MTLAPAAPTVSTWRTWRVPQDKRTSPCAVSHAKLAYRYAYSPSNESLAGGRPGQDYLVISERINPPALAFALCDGVSQSFYGNIGSRFLGDALVSWLSHLEGEQDAVVVRQSLKEMLQWATLFGQVQVERQELPTELEYMTREVMELQRTEGTESMFICGRIDEPCAVFSKGRAVVAWMGDSRLRLWGTGAPGADQLRATFDTRERWSSRIGLGGAEPHLIVAHLEDATAQTLTRLLMYSDGLKSIDDKWQEPVTDDLVWKEIDASLADPDSDDISYLEIWLTGVPSLVEEVASEQTPTSNATVPPEPNGLPQAEHRAPRRVRSKVKRRAAVRGIVLALLLLAVLLSVKQRSNEQQNAAPEPTLMLTPTPATPEH